MAKAADVVVQCLENEGVEYVFGIPGEENLDLLESLRKGGLSADEAFARESGMTYVPLTELYRRSDIISLHCPLTDRTLHMIDAEAIGQMKDGVIIINTGRGQLIRTSDLIEGLKEKKIGAAGLDVYEEEADYFYQDTSDRIMDDDMLARLLSFNNVILTSHQGFFTREALDNIARTTLENIQAFSHGECLNEVKYK